MVDKLKLWLDPEGDYLEVTFSDASGYMRSTNSDAVMQAWTSKAVSSVSACSA